MKTADLEVGKDYAVGSNSDMRRKDHFRIKRAVVQKPGTHYALFDRKTQERHIFSSKSDAEKYLRDQGEFMGFSWERRLARGVLVRYINETSETSYELGQQTLVPAQQIQMPWSEFVPIRDAEAAGRNRMEDARREITETLERVGVGTVGPIRLGPEHADGGFPLASVYVNWKDLKRIIEGR